MRRAIREAPKYWPLKAAPQNSLESSDMESQTTLHSPKPPPNPAPPFSTREPQKGKKKTQKTHHTTNFQQPSEPPQPFHSGLPPIDWEKCFSDMENVTQITTMQQPKTSKNSLHHWKPGHSCQPQINHVHPLVKESTPKLFHRTMTWKHGIILGRFCLNAEISAMMQITRIPRTPNAIS